MALACELAKIVFYGFVIGKLGLLYSTFRGVRSWLRVCCSNETQNSNMCHASSSSTWPGDELLLILHCMHFIQETLSRWQTKFKFETQIGKEKKKVIWLWSIFKPAPNWTKSGNIRKNANGCRKSFINDSGIEQWIILVTLKDTLLKAKHNKMEFQTFLILLG